MKGRILNIVLVLVLATLPMAANAGWSEARQVTDQALPAPAMVEETPAPDVDFKSNPVMFIENVGQWDDGARFQVWGGPTGTMWLADDAIWITVVEPGETSRQVGKGFDPMVPFEDQEEPAPRRGVNIKLSFVDANPHPRIETFDRLDTTVSYFYGNDPEQWRPDVPVWDGVRYVDLYPGIDLVLASEDGQMVQRLATRPGADLAAVQLRVQGADAVAVDGDRLRLSTAVGEPSIRLLQTTGSNGAPAVQPREGRVFEVSTPFATKPPINESSLFVPDSPVDNPSDLIVGTFLGGSSRDTGNGLAVDETGGAYVAGITGSSNFPTTPGAFDTGFNGGTYDTFVVKLNPAGNALIYATFLGGSRFDNAGRIAVDVAGSIYVTGSTESSNFPTTPGAFDTGFNGGTDAFVVKLNPTGNALVYATFLGGINQDGGWAIALDGASSAYVTGNTGSSNFPITPGAFDTSHNLDTDAFVVKLNPTGSALAYATFLGGVDEDQSIGLAVDEAGSAHVTGYTRSSDFPTTLGAFDTSFNGGSFDAFVVKLNPAGSALAYATFLGGVGNDLLYNIVVEVTGGAYVTGYTTSANFPATPGAFDTSFTGGIHLDAVVAKLNPTGSALAYATFLGGVGDDRGIGLAVDETGSAHVTGYSFSSDFPTTPGAFDTSFNGGYIDAFVVKLNPAGNVLVYATFLGGSWGDSGWNIVIDETGSVYLTVDTESSDIPTTPGAFDTSFNGGSYDAFVAKLALAGTLPTTEFLELPFPYTAYAQTAVGWTGLSSQGRVNSWFDHQYPTYTSAPNNQHPGLVKYTGDQYSTTSQGVSWYDGHDGIDFTARIGSRDVQAAAGGTVSGVYNTCNQTCYGGSCCERLGNRVEIDHGNGHTTIYGHLEFQSIPATVTLGTVVTQGSFLGRMGNTGNSNGAHLHFGVKALVDGSWVVVDPYGWIGTASNPNDPWAAHVNGAVSNYLWRRSLNASATFPANQGTITSDAAGFALVNIGPSQTGGMVSATLTNTPAPAPGSSLRRSLGRFFSLFLELLPLQSRAEAMQPTPLLTYTVPITITMPYFDTDLLHFDASELAIHRWDDAGQTWTPLQTTIDPQTNHVVAVTNLTGKFDLQAPLLCPAEFLEPDDTYDAARSIWQNDPPIERVFDVADDTDWAMFQAVAGVTYTIRTQNLAAGVVTVLSIYEDAEFMPELAVQGDVPGRTSASELVWVAPHDGTFYFAVTPGAGSSIGCNATYELLVSTIPGDVTGDCQVDVMDIQRTVEAWLTIEGQYGYLSVFDQDHDGDVDIVDIQLVARYWGQICQLVP